MPAASREILLRFALRVTELNEKEHHLQSELAAVRCELDELESLVQPYLHLLSQPRSSGVPAISTVPADTPTPAVRPSPTVFSADDIRYRALAILEDMPEGMKAIQIAKQIDPPYDPDNDNRAFENRVYTILKRDDRFAKSRRGHWVLREYKDFLSLGDVTDPHDDGDDGDAARDARGATLATF